MVVFATGLLAVGTTGITTWATANDNNKSLIDQKIRTDSLEKSVEKLKEMQAVTSQQVLDMKSTQDANSGKLDRILELEMRRK